MMNGVASISVELSSDAQGQASDHRNETASEPYLDKTSPTTAEVVARGNVLQSTFLTSSPMPSTETSPLNPNVDELGKFGIVGKSLRFLFLGFKFVFSLFFPSCTFIKFFIHAIIPALADNLVPLFFIGNIPNESALAIAGQYTFIGVIVEVIQEGIVNSLFHYVGRNYSENRRVSLQALKICLVILALLGSLLTVIMTLFNSQFVKLIDTPEALAEATRNFLYASSLSFPFVLVGAGLSNYLLITASSYLVLAQLSSVTLSFVSNFFLFGQHEYSLHWNIHELGYYKIIQTGLSCLNSLVFTLLIERLGPLEFIVEIPFLSQFRSNFKELFKLSWGNFGDSAVRNFFYFMVTLKFINNLGETEVAAWNLLNTIVWGLLLIPSYTVTNYAKVKIGHNGSKTVIRSVAIRSSISLLAWLAIVSVLSFIFWPELADFFGSSNNDAKVLSTKLFHEMGWIFIIFSINNAMDSLFFGIGRTQYVFYQSVITNLVVYLVPWILYLTDIITPTYWLVVGLYLAGMIVDFCLTAYFCFIVWRGI